MEAIEKWLTQFIISKCKAAIAKSASFFFAPTMQCIKNMDHSHLLKFCGCRRYDQDGNFILFTSGAILLLELYIQTLANKL